MRWLLVGVAFVTAASLGCSGRPADQPNQGVPDPPKPVEQPKDRVRPVALTEEDWKTALPREYPAALRRGMSDEQLAKDLELQAWAFEFNGGPLYCWLEFEESGQKTVASRLEFSAFVPGSWDIRAGRIVFSVGRAASERMKGIMQKVDKDADPDVVAFNLRAHDPAEGKSGTHGYSLGGSPLWFGWSGGEKKWIVRADPIAAAGEGEVFTLVRVECTEPKPAKKDMPRSVVLTLRGSFGGPKK